MLARVSIPRQVFLVVMLVHAEAKAVSMNILGFQTALVSVLGHAVIQRAVGMEVELSFDHLEIQAETQGAAATSSPDPLTLDGPEDRDIDLSPPLPYSASDSSEVCEQNQLVVFLKCQGISFRLRERGSIWVK